MALQRIPATDVHANFIAWQEDSKNAEFSAKEVFKEMRATGKYANIRLIMSAHPYSEGWWIEWGSKLPPLSEVDYIVPYNQLNTILTAY